MWTSFISCRGISRSRQAALVGLVVVVGFLLGVAVWLRLGRGLLPTNGEDSPGEVKRTWDFEVMALWDQLGLAGPEGIDVCDGGDVIVADTGNDRILRLNGSGVVLGSADAILSPVRVTCDDGGDVLVVSRDSGLFRVRMDEASTVDPFQFPGFGDAPSASGMRVTDIDVCRFIRVGTSVESAYVVATSGTGDSSSSIVLVSQDAATRAFPLPLRNGRHGLLGVVEPIAVAADPGGTAEIAYCTSVETPQPVQWLVPRVWGFAPRVSPNGETKALYDSELSGSARDLDFDSMGNLVVLDGVDGRIVAYDSSGRRAGSYVGRGPGFASLKQPMGLAISGEMVFVADTGNDRIVVLRERETTAVHGR